MLNIAIFSPTRLIDFDKINCGACMYRVCDPGLHRQYGKKVNLTKQVLCFSAGLPLVFCSQC